MDDRVGMGLGQQRLAVLADRVGCGGVSASAAVRCEAATSDGLRRDVGGCRLSSRDLVLAGLFADFTKDDLGDFVSIESVGSITFCRDLVLLAVEDHAVLGASDRRLVESMAIFAVGYTGASRATRVGVGAGIRSSRNPSDSRIEVGRCSGGTDGYWLAAADRPCPGIDRSAT